jgi:cytochrome c
VVCHSFEKGGKVVYGPNRFDIVGKPAGAIKGYEYSVALKNSGLTWTDKNLVGFMANPEQFVKGTKARFPGLKSAKQKADILAYMKTLK